MPPRRSSRRRNQKKPRGRWGKDPDGREYHSEEDVEDEENDDESDDDNEFPQRTTKEKLIFLNVDLRDLEQAKAKGGLHEEFKIVKKRYYREALRKHPDKGGTERDFLELDVVWQSLRVMYERNLIASYWEEAQKKVSAKRTKTKKAAREYTQTRQAKPRKPAAAKKRKKSGEEEEEETTTHQKTYRSYRFYEEAAEYDDPEYRVELARSARSSCVANTGGIACEHANEKIEKDEIRCGHRNPTSGSFGNWSHLRCWRIPNAFGSDFRMRT
jgi:murein DD-endopeptidase MepM/ murein hydrolase activator NlpD